MTKMQYQGQFETIVVDDGGSVALDDLIDSYRQVLNIRILRQSHAGPAAARNTGARIASGMYLGFVDDDCTLAPDWLTIMTAILRQQSIASLAGGQTINALNDNIFSTASQALIDYIYSYNNADPTAARFFTSNNMAVSKQQFEQAGAFDTRFPRAGGEDRELCDRWWHLGFDLRFVPAARVFHFHDLGLRSFLRQHFNYGRGALLFHLNRAERQQGRYGLEPLRFYWGLAAIPWRQGLRRPFASFLLLVLSQVANALGLIVAGIQHHRNRSERGKVESDEVS